MLPGDCFERVVTYPASFGHIRRFNGAHRDRHRQFLLPSLGLLKTDQWPGKPGPELEYPTGSLVREPVLIHFFLATTPGSTSDGRPASRRLLRGETSSFIAVPSNGRE